MEEEMDTRKMVRQSWKLAAILAIMAIVLAACAPQATPAPTAAPTEVPTAAPTAAPVAVTTVIQDFETDAVPYEAYQAAASLATDVFFTGAQSLKSESSEGEWHSVGVNLGKGAVDLTPYSKLCFYVYDTSTANSGGAKNTVGVKLIDATGANVERYTDNEGVGANVKTKFEQWTLMCMNLISFTGIDQTKVEKIEFTMYNPGVYYFDDITLLPAGEELAMPEVGGSEEVVTDLQTFEAADTFYSDYQADVSLATDIVHGGKSSLLASSASGEWHAFGAYPEPRPVDLSKASKLCFWIYDTTANNDGKADNTVGVKLFDASGANEEVWTDHELAGGNPKTVQNEWTQMCINLDAYTTVDLTAVDKIQFALYWAGNYYVDDIQMVSGGAVATEPVVAQDFEKADTFYSDYQADVSLATDVVHGGKSSLMATSASGEWHAFGAYPEPRPIDMSGMKQLCFWIYDTTANNDGKADNTVGVKLFDAGGTNEEVWTDHELAGENPKTVQNEWTQMCINLDAYTTVDLSAVDKIQFALYWAGTYYVDDITLIPGGGQPAKAEEPEAAVRRVADMVQDFEKDGTFYSDYQADVSLATDIFHGGKSSLLAASTEGEWHAFGAYPAVSPLDLTGYDQLSFWIYDTTTNNAGKADNSVGVKLFDASGTSEEIWTDNAAAGKNSKTVTNEWVKMTLNLSAFTTVDLSKIEKIQFALYWAGNYYIDDIMALKPVELTDKSAVLQDFEKADSFYTDYQADVSLATDIFHGGKSSLLAASSSGEWHSFGGYPATRPMDISTYGKLCFWIYDTTANNSGKADNSVGVKLFDAAGVSEEFWTDHAAVGKNPKTVQNEWTQMCLDLNAFSNVDLRKIDKVQFALYWAGNYYVDDITLEP